MANTQFIGNNDYRGYLSYLSQNDTSPTGHAAGQLLKYVGNDAQFGVGTGRFSQDFMNTNQNLYNQFNKLNTAPAGNIGSIYGGGGGGSPAPVYAPKLDVAAVNAQARQAAENAVNPFYTKQLNEFLTQQGVLKQQKQTQYATDVQNLQDTLANQLQGNETSRGRATQDEATNQAQINQNADQFQVDQGKTFEDQRLAAARGQAVSGTLNTGAGNRQTTLATEAQNTLESRQGQQFQQSKDQQALLKGRSLEDLLRSDDLSKTAEVKGEKQATFDLNNYMQGLGYQEQQTRNSLEQERLQRVGQETGNQSKLAFTRYLSTIKNPAQYAAAVSTYGGLF